MPGVPSFALAGPNPISLFRSPPSISKPPLRAKSSIVRVWQVPPPLDSEQNIIRFSEASYRQQLVWVVVKGCRRKMYRYCCVKERDEQKEEMHSGGLVLMMSWIGYEGNGLRISPEDA